MKSINSDIAYDFIRKRILSGEYSPGAALMTETLSAEIGVSRTPVRDALRQLETDGLVSIRPRLGASVKKMDLKEFRDMCDLRLALEGHAAAQAARNRTETDLREISFALEAMRRLTSKLRETKSESCFNELVREDVRFHIAIMTAAKNEVMKKEILRLHLINRVVSGPAGGPEQLKAKTEVDSRRRLVLAMHDEIYEAIAKSDPVGARQAMERHLQEPVDRMLRLMAEAETGAESRGLTPEELIYST